jgi:iron transport multicopper oxidase
MHLTVQPRTAALRVLLGALLAASALVVPVIKATIAKADTLQESSDNSSSGWYPNEAQLSLANVTSGSFGEIFDTQLNGQVYAQPLVSGSTVLAVTENDNAYGLNSTTGAIQWQNNYGTPDDPLQNTSCGDVGSALGITGTPVIDSSGIAYFVSAQEEPGDNNAYFMQAVEVQTGETPPGWPAGGVPIVGHADNAPGTVFNPDWQMQRPGLVLVSGVIYAAFGSQCDHGTWQGWVVGVSSSTQAITTIWSSEENDTGTQGAGTWQAGSAPVVDSNGDIFVSTGNGDIPSSAEPGSDVSNENYGEAVVELHTNTSGQLEPVDFFIPDDAVSLNSQDGDLGSGGPVALPSSMGTTGDPTPMVIDGKSGILYVLNMNNLGGYEQGSGATDAVESESATGGGVWGKASVWPGDGGYVYLATAGGSPFEAGDGSLEVFQRTDTSGTLTLPMVGATGNSGNVFGYGSGSPVITSTSPTANSALVWIIHATSGSGYDSQLEAFNAVPENPGPSGTLEQVWSSPTFTSTVFSQPAVNDGILYVGTKDGTLLGFGAVPSSTPALTGSDLSFPSTIVAQSSAAMTATFVASAQTTVSSFTVAGPGYNIGTPSRTLPATLASGQSISVPVTFTPQAFGANPGTLTANFTGATASIDLSGQGDTTNPSLSFSPDEVTFAPQLIGASQVFSPVTVTNISSSDITVSGFVSPTSPFGDVDYPTTPLTLAPSGQSGDSFTLNIGFSAPGSSGDFDHDFNALTTIETSVGNFGIALSGSADPPAQIVTEPPDLNFGDVAVGSSTTLNFELGDQGGFPLDITESTPPNPASGFSALTSPFTQLASPYQIAPNTSLQETVQFAPTSDGPFSATWLLEGNDGNGVQTVTLSGTGYTPPVTTTTSPTTTTTSPTTTTTSPTTTTTTPTTTTTSPTTTTTTPTTTTTTPTTTTTEPHRPTLTITTRAGRLGSDLTLRTSGDAGGGKVTFRARNGSATGCVLHGSVLSAERAGTCIVTAVKAARGATRAVSSQATAVTFAKVNRHG